MKSEKRAEADAARKAKWADRRTAIEAKEADRKEKYAADKIATKAKAAEQKEARQAPRKEAEAQVQALVSAGQWWIAPKTFGGGFSNWISVAKVHYLGGWSGHPEPHTGRMSDENVLKLDPDGLTYSHFKKLFTIGWEQIVRLDIERPGASVEASNGWPSARPRSVRAGGQEEERRRPADSTDQPPVYRVSA